jgi:Restriction endonuclease
MQNPEISGIEYQQGTLQGYEIREYLLEKFKHKCAYCPKKNVPLEIEHIIPKSRGGSNRVSNLTIACHECNQKKDNLTAEEFGFPNVQAQAKKPLKASTFMNIVKKRLFETLVKNDPSTTYTYGYITKCNRILHNLPKSHSNDAFIIAGGFTQERIIPYTSTQTRRNNRSIQTNRKGYKPSIRRQKYSFQPNDLVKHNNLLFRVKGVFNYGKWIRLVDSVGTIINSNIKKVELITYGKGIQFT